MDVGVKGLEPDGLARLSQPEQPKVSPFQERMGQTPRPTAAALTPPGWHRGRLLHGAEAQHHQSMRAVTVHRARLAVGPHGEVRCMAPRWLTPRGFSPPPGSSRSRAVTCSGVHGSPDPATGLIDEGTWPRTRSRYGGPELPAPTTTSRGVVPLVACLLG
jgi:hypothetical protein